jgi:hypothetical protein
MILTTFIVFLLITSGITTYGYFYNDSALIFAGVLIVILGVLTTINGIETQTGATYTTNQTTGVQSVQYEYESIGSPFPRIIGLTILIFGFYTLIQSLVRVQYREDYTYE